jgi:tetratricopeptide (TPR) repeat protein
VAGLDPFFSHAYLYGAGALAWNMGRPDEAAKLLHRGIIAMERYQENSTLDLHQPYWQFNLYLSAIIYRKAGELEKMLSLLEVAVQQKDCPNMMKSILANIYQKDKKYVQALKLWMSVYDSNDPSYRVRAERKIFELKEVLKI